jgi:endonuclease III
MELLYCFNVPLLHMKRRRSTNPAKHRTRIPLHLPAVLGVLRRRHTPPRTFLHFRTPLDLLVATILSAQCTDKRVNHVTKSILYPKYRKAEDYARVSRGALEHDIHSCGTFRNKAKNIQRTCVFLLQRHDGKVPKTMEELTALPGVGRKTAAVVLWAGFGKAEGIAVDTHVLRVTRRLGFSCGKTPQRIERDLMRSTARKNWGEVTTLLISHGRAVCTARRRHCDRCPFAKKCPSSWTMGCKDRTKQDKR